MEQLLQVVLLGIIEGITEFLPISSTGHLLVAQHLGLGARSDLFNIVIQAGAILAVTFIYWQRVWTLFTGLGQQENRDYFMKLAVSFLITAVLGLIASKLGLKLPTEINPVAWAFVIGGVWMLVAEWLAAKRSSSEQITWTIAIAIGVAQIVAGIFPGTSRSGATIFIAMLLGSTRIAATEFTFLVGIPTMYAASANELYKALKTDDTNEDWSLLIIGFVVSAVVAFIAVKWLLRYIQTHRFTVFAVYRLIVGVALLMWL